MRVEGDELFELLSVVTSGEGELDGLGAGEGKRLGVVKEVEEEEHVHPCHEQGQLVR